MESVSHFATRSWLPCSGLDAYRSPQHQARHSAEGKIARRRASETLRSIASATSSNVSSTSSSTFAPSQRATKSRRPAGSSRPAQQNPASLINLLQLWLSQGGLPGNRQLRLSRCIGPPCSPCLRHEFGCPLFIFGAREGIYVLAKKSLLRSARRLLREIRERTN